jgi:hypothetical protein
MPLHSSTTPPSVDYTGAPLRVGQSVTFIEIDQDWPGSHRLYTGEIKLIGREQLVVDSGKLFIVEGRECFNPDEIRYSSVLGLPAQVPAG